VALEGAPASDNFDEVASFHRLPRGSGTSIVSDQPIVLEEACPLWAKSGHALVRCKYLPLTQSGHGGPISV
jgi:hypothetical protein